MKEVDAMKTNRAASWQLYKNAPMPMVTIFKTLDISNLMLLHSKGYKLNMLMCYCIVVAGNNTPQFRLLPVENKMFEYDKIGVNVIVANKNGGINSCDIPFNENLGEFNDYYLCATERVKASCENHEIENSMIIGTSSLVAYDIDGVVNMYSGIFNNPFIIWGKYKKENDKTLLQISFQFHHVQMDGADACEFLEKLQKTIDALRK